VKIGIVVFSRTNNTFSVAKELEALLNEKGCNAVVERITIKDNSSQSTDVVFDYLPALSKYYSLIFCSPVEGFSLSNVMLQYLKKISTLKNKKTALLVTQFFPFAFLGGNRAIKQMKSLCEQKGASVCGNEIINWSKKERQQQIKQTIQRLGELFFYDEI
jgi:flavodoxin